eukprot:PhM_4_TR8086/c0_g1_i1/m.6040
MYRHRLVVGVGQEVARIARILSAAHRRRPRRTVSLDFLVHAVHTRSGGHGAGGCIPHKPSERSCRFTEVQSAFLCRIKGILRRRPRRWFCEAGRRWGHGGVTPPKHSVEKSRRPRRRTLRLVQPRRLIALLPCLRRGLLPLNRRARTARFRCVVDCVVLGLSVQPRALPHRNAVHFVRQGLDGVEVLRRQKHTLRETRQVLGVAGSGTLGAQLQPEASLQCQHAYFGAVEYSNHISSGHVAAVQRPEWQLRLDDPRWGMKFDVQVCELFKEARDGGALAQRDVCFLRIHVEHSNRPTRHCNAVTTLLSLSMAAIVIVIATVIIAIVL